ncbi:hypothetical protein G3I76_70610, partial [Streptomyces sp. SID11233]|nr:hypothetical protein [Streptomyces sp. SID11233]
DRQARTAAIRNVRRTLAQAERGALAHTFAQTSVDLLRGADPDPEFLAAGADFATRPSAYYQALETATAPADRACAHR